MKTQPARTVMQHIEALSQISEEPGRLTRTFCSPAMRRANDLVGSWMRQAGMQVREDAIGNVIGRYASARQNAKILLLGSHLDTVRDAGRFDGALGVLIAIACVQQLHNTKTRLPFAIEVIGFADEEGVRYQSAYLGSKALAGTLRPKDLKRTDAAGITVAQAIRGFGGNPDGLASARLHPQRLLGYVEVHIEQGPVLEQKNVAVGVVTAIAGQTRAKVVFIGMAGHAGTTPMGLRRDALCAAAEFILAVESLGTSRAGLVTTVGEITARPGASNVISGEVRLSLDVRHPLDAARQDACMRLRKRAAAIAAKRRVRCEWQLVDQTAAVKCDLRLSRMLSKAVKRNEKRLICLPSGAGHDAAAVAAIAPAAMLFVRCKGGISHHPNESASEADLKVAIRVMNDFLQMLSPDG